MQTPIYQKRPNFIIPFSLLQMPPLHSAARGGCPLRPPSRRHCSKYADRKLAAGVDVTEISPGHGSTIPTDECDVKKWHGRGHPEHLELPARVSMLEKSLYGL